MEVALAASTPVRSGRSDVALPRSLHPELRPESPFKEELFDQGIGVGYVLRLKMANAFLGCRAPARRGAARPQAAPRGRQAFSRLGRRGAAPRASSGTARSGLTG